MFRQNPILTISRVLLVLTLESVRSIMNTYGDCFWVFVALKMLLWYYIPSYWERGRSNFSGLTFTISCNIAMFGCVRIVWFRPGFILGFNWTSSNFYTNLITVDAVGAFIRPKVVRNVRTVTAAHSPFLYWIFSINIRWWLLKLSMTINLNINEWPSNRNNNRWQK